MQLESSVTLFDDEKVESKFAELVVDADGIRTEVSKKVGNNEVISKINQSAESVQIHANKVAIEGAAIFTSGRLSTTSLNNAYDANGSATGAVNGLKNDLSSASGTTVINGGHIATGTLSANAVNAASGTFNTANIPNLSADKITTGTINIGRLPAKGRADTYITDISGDDGIKVHDSTNVNNYAQIDSSGFDVRVNDVSYAKYGLTSRIGKEGTSRIEMDYHSMQLKDSDSPSHTYFWVSDLRDENNEYAYTEIFTGNGTKKRFTLAFSPKNRNVTVTVSDGSGGAATISDTLSLWLDFETAPSDGATITVSYVTSSYLAKAYTLGMRKANSVIGPLSTCFGLYCTASESRSFAEGWYSEANGSGSHAEGYETKANGSYSHAQGDSTVANRAYQVVIGKFNEIDNYGYNTGSRGNYVFIIGNGTDDNARSNALTVDWNGNEVIAGRLTQSSDRRLKKHIAYLDEDAEEFIRNLKPAHFIKDEENHVGFYAQDVAEADKWDCMTGEMNGYMTLGYTELIAPLVTYCQKLELRIEQLENKLKEER